MAIKRARRDNRYTIMSNMGLQHRGMSWRARGMLAYMLSMPDDWIFYETELAKQSESEGKHVVSNTLKELEERGYLVRSQKRRTDGKFGEKDWTIYDEPQNVDITTFPPSPDLPCTAEPTTANRQLQSTNKQSTNNTKDIVELKPDELSLKVKLVVDYLNEKAGKSFKHSTQTTRKHIKARFAEGFTINDFKRVIDAKVQEWSNDSNMDKYLRPQTLFGTKFEAYLNETRPKEKTKRSRGTETFTAETFFDDID